MNRNYLKNLGEIWRKFLREAASSIFCILRKRKFVHRIKFFGCFKEEFGYKSLDKFGTNLEKNGKKVSWFYQMFCQIYQITYLVKSTKNFPRINEIIF